MDRNNGTKLSLQCPGSSVLRRYKKFVLNAVYVVGFPHDLETDCSTDIWTVCVLHDTITRVVTTLVSRVFYRQTSRESEAVTCRRYQKSFFERSVCDGFSTRP